MEPAARAAGRDALIAWLVVLGLVTGLVRIDIKLPAIGHLGNAPVAVAWRRTEDLYDYGFHARPLVRGLVIAGTAIVVIFPLFALGYFAFYEVACNSSLLAFLPQHDLCRSYRGLHGIHAPHLVWNPLREDSFSQFCLVQLVVVALPEELFFRGMLLRLLEQRFPPRRRILGGGVGLALVLSAAAFALVHLPKDGDPRALATFFPGLLFGWMRSATGSITASTITHGASNILIRLLDLCVLQ